MLWSLSSESTFSSHSSTLCNTYNRIVKIKLTHIHIQTSLIEIETCYQQHSTLYRQHRLESNNSSQEQVLFGKFAILKQGYHWSWFQIKIVLCCLLTRMTCVVKYVSLFALRTITHILLYLQTMFQDWRSFTLIRIMEYFSLARWDHWRWSQWWEFKIDQGLYLDQLLFIAPYLLVGGRGERADRNNNVEQGSREIIGLWFSLKWTLWDTSQHQPALVQLKHKRQ